MQIVAENLTFTYSPKSKKLAVRALDKVNLTINEGEFFGIVGRTGSGKSTFIQHLNGLIKVQENGGKLLVGEYVLSQKKCDYKGLRARLGMVFQYPEYQLFAETVYQDVAFGLRNFNANLSAEEEQDLIKQAIEMVGLNYDEVKDKSPFDLSGGQKRRVAIAGVIVTKPEVLILDEPAAGLDPKGKREFIKLLKDLHASFVKTIVIVSHDMNIISENCSSMAIFSSGSIVKTASPNDIFKDSRLIEQAGLELPVIAELLNSIRQVDRTFDCDLTAQAFIDAFATKYGGIKE